MSNPLLKPRISPQEIAVFRALLSSDERWLTAREVSARAEGVSDRTVRAILTRYRHGLVEWVEVFPEFRYRLTTAVDNPEVAEYVARLRQAAAALGVPLPVLPEGRSDV